ncbi:MAG: hypothetical protein ACE5GG_00355 [Candidatus Omnitrophota bacterium]
MGDSSRKPQENNARRSTRLGQNTAEYAVLIGLIIGAVVAMQTYVKRSMQAGVKYAVDKLKDNGTGQYEPYYLMSKTETTTEAYEQTEETKNRGAVERHLTGKDGAGGQVTTRTSTQKMRDTSAAD